MFRRHCTDETLLALLDAELDLLSRLIVSRHVRSCWMCRARVSELEDQIQDLSLVWRRARLDSSSGVEHARRRFEQWAWTREFDTPRRAWWPLRLPATFRAPVIVGLGSILLVGGVTVWEMRQQTEPVPLKAKIPVAALSAPPVAPPRRSQPVKQVARLERSPLPTELHPIPPAEPSESQLLETEMEIRWLLHRVGASKGEPVEVTRTEGNRILVHGVAPTRRRRAQLDAALKEIADRDFVHIKLEAAENLVPLKRAVRPAASPSQHSGPPESPSAFQLSAAAALRSLYPLDTKEQCRQRLVGVTNHAIRVAEEASAEAWAIRRLESRFPAETTAKLFPQSRELLLTMAREHLLALRAHVADLDALLTPILSRQSPPSRVPDTLPDLFSRVERLRALVQSSFAGGPLAESPADASGEISVLGKFLSNELLDVDAVVSRAFPEMLAGAPAPAHTSR